MSENYISGKLSTLERPENKTPKDYHLEFLAVLALRRILDGMQDQVAKVKLQAAFDDYLNQINASKTGLEEPEVIFDSLLLNIPVIEKDKFYRLVKRLIQTALVLAGSVIFTGGIATATLANAPAQSQNWKSYNEQVLVQNRELKLQVAEQAKTKINTVTYQKVKASLHSSEFRLFLSKVYEFEGKGQTVNDEQKRGNQSFGGLTNSGILEETFVRVRHDYGPILTQLAEENPALKNIMHKGIETLSIEEIDTIYNILYLESGADKFPPDLAMAVYDTIVQFGPRAGMIFGVTSIRTNAHPVGEGLGNRLPAGHPTNMVSFPKLDFNVQTPEDASKLANEIVQRRKWYRKYLGERSTSAASFTKGWLRRDEQLGRMIDQLKSQSQKNTFKPIDLEFFYYCGLDEKLDEVGQPVLYMHEAGLDQKTNQKTDPEISAITQEQQNKHLESQLGKSINETKSGLNEKSESQPSQFEKIDEQNLGQAIVEYMKQKGYKIYEDGRINITFVDCMNLDGSLNSCRDNYFDAIYVAFRVKNNQIEIVHKSIASVRPGDHFKTHAMNDAGTGRLVKGQYLNKWHIGQHGTNKHNKVALIQNNGLAGQLNIERSKGTPSEKSPWNTFEFSPINTDNYIDMHWGYNYYKNKVDNASAGCLVIPDLIQYKQIMGELVNDANAMHYKFFTITVMDGNEIYTKLGTDAIKKDIATATLSPNSIVATIGDDMSVFSLGDTGNSNLAFLNDSF